MGRFLIGLDRIAAIVLALSVLTGAGAKPPPNGWSVIHSPTTGPARAVGSTANGCLSGGVQLPADGPGYEVIRLSRRRYFGHGDTVDFLQGLGRRVQASGLPVFYVGDMAQPRGGPLPFGHASHQTGLDVDIWFTLDTKAGLSQAEREEPDLPSMLFPGDPPRIDTAHFGRRQVTVLRLAAADPRVDRIFVNPVIKLALCHGFGGAAEGGPDWLRTLRPWWGHDDHFHVRLRCPADSPDCEPQKPIPDGDGCDAALEDWTHHLAPVIKKHEPVIPKTLPAACQAIMRS